MGCINFFTVTAKPRQQEKSPSYLLTPQNALSPALSKLAKVKLRTEENWGFPTEHPAAVSAPTLHSGINNLP